MNGNPYTTNFIGSTGLYPIQDYINSNISNTSNYVLNTSNILELNIDNTSNILQTQITATSNLIYKDNDLNTIVRISAQNPLYPTSGNPVEMRFLNVNNEYLTKIIQTGELFVYHPLTPLPAGYSAGWWSVEGKIAFAITETQGLRLDVTNLQVLTGTIANDVIAAQTTANSAFTLATTANATAGTALAQGTVNATEIATINNTLPTLVSSTQLTNTLTNYYDKTASDGRFLRLGFNNTLSANVNITLSGTGTFSGNLSGNGSAITSINYNNITANALTFSSPLSKSVANVVSIDLSTYQPLLTFNSPLSKTANAVSIDLTAYQPLLTFSSPLSKTANAVSIDLSTYQPLLTFSSPLSKTANTVSIDLSAYQPLLTFSSPLSKTANTVSIDLSAYLTTAIANNTYVQRAGSTMTGKLNITPATIDIPSLTTYGGNGDRIVLYTGDATTYPYSIGIASGSLWNSVPTNANFDWYINGVIKMKLNSSGNLGIGTTNPGTNILQVGNAGRLKIGLGSTDYSLIGTLDTDGATNTRIVVSGNTRNLYAGNIDYLATSTGNHLFYTTNTNVERVRIKSDGNVGIGTNNPTAKLHIEHSGTATNPTTSGLYVYNPNNSANNSSVIGCRIAGSSANKAIYSLDVSGFYGWSMYISGSDTTNRLLRFNTSWDTNGTDRFTIAYNGQTTCAVNVWHLSSDNKERIWYDNNGASYFHSANGIYYFRNSDQSKNRITIDDVGKMTFDNELNDMRIQLWDGYGFGINGGTLRYNSGNLHRFYTGTTNTFTIDSIGNATSASSFGTSGVISGGGIIKGRNFMDYGRDLSYTVGYNGSTASGWFWQTNEFWDSGIGGSTGGQYLKISINPLSMSTVYWFGRAYLIPGGGLVGITTDYQQPTFGTNTISVQNFWGPNGGNALYIQITNAVFGGTMRVKVS